MCEHGDDCFCSLVLCIPTPIDEEEDGYEVTTKYALPAKPEPEWWETLFGMGAELETHQYADD